MLVGRSYWRQHGGRQETPCLADAPPAQAQPPSPLALQVAQHSLPALTAAPQLEYLCITSIPKPPATLAAEALWQRWWDWAASHPPLRCLGLDMGPDDAEQLSMALLDALLALARRRPGLRIRRTVPPADNLSWARSSEALASDFFFFWEEMLACQDVPVV